MTKKNIGFARMPPARVREIASAGGKAARGKGHHWDKEAARRAGSKGGGAKGRISTKGGADCYDLANASPLECTVVKLRIAGLLVKEIARQVDRVPSSVTRILCKCIRRDSDGQGLCAKGDGMGAGGDLSPDGDGASNLPGNGADGRDS